MKKILIAAAAGLLALAAGAASAQDAKPGKMVVYDTALGAGWENWSWADTELSLEVNGTARKPILIEAGPWEALYFHRAPFSTAGYEKLSFLIQAPAPAGQQVRVQALADGKALPGEGHLVKVATGGWTKVEIPLATLGAENATIDGIWLQNATAADAPRFYVTEVTID